MNKLVLASLLVLGTVDHRIFAQVNDPCLAPIHLPIHARSAAQGVVTKLKDKALVVEYPSVYEVHNKPDTVKYPNIRIQPVVFDVPKVLDDIKNFVSSDKVDFVLFFFLQEVPGWINSGGRYKNLAQNIGLPNTTLNTSPIAWPRLKSNPHMNDVDFLSRTDPALPNYGSTLTVFHEIGHLTSVFFCQASPGPRDWNKTMPVAHLGAASSHWTWNYIKENNVIWPGIMYSGATAPIFNAFDLYAMGLMSYEECSKQSYTIYEDPDKSKTHKLKLDDLIFSLMQAGGNIYNAPGKRIPSTDPTMANLNVLTVIVKGQDEKMSPKDSSLIIKLVDEIPRDWNIATWGRSKMASNLNFTNAVQISTPQEDVAKSSVTIYWNQSTNKLAVKLPSLQSSQSTILTIHDIQGRLVARNKISQLSNEIAVPEFTGIAIITIQKDNKTWESKKVIIMK